MHDPLVVAFEIRRPWPCSDAYRTRRSAEQGIRWRLGNPYPVLAGRGLYWPSLITVWHRDPSGYDTTTCPLSGRWRVHVHHWRLQVHVLQHLRRRLLTRCEWCGGRDGKGDRVNVSSWDGPHARWWQGKRGLYHRDCSSISTAHHECVCEDPLLEHGSWGKCALCGKFRAHGITPEQLARVRKLAAIPGGARRAEPDFDVEVD